MLAEWAVEYMNTITSHLFGWFRHLLDAIDAWYLFLGVFALAMFVLLILMPLRGFSFSDKALPVGAGLPSAIMRRHSDRAVERRQETKYLSSGGD